MEPIRLECVASGRGTPDRYVTIETDGDPLMRVDLYGSNGESFAFEEAQSWCGWLVIGWGQRLFLISLKTRGFAAIGLDAYFGHLYPSDNYLLVASAERLLRIEKDGKVRWQSDVLGIDGVVVDGVADGLISGRGEWDPPGGWRTFQVDLDSGAIVGTIHGVKRQEVER
jgi:hypothetical protein